MQLTSFLLALQITCPHAGIQLIPILRGACEKA